MKHYILTSSKFDGQIVYKYDAAGYLVYFSYEAEMNEEQRTWALTKMPLTASGFTDMVGKSTTVKVQEIKQDLGFDAFWEAYDHKLNRKRCEPLWNKMNEKNRLLCLNSIRAYNKYLERTGIRKKDPEGYLKNEMYHNDYHKLK